MLSLSLWPCVWEKEEVEKLLLGPSPSLAVRKFT